MTTQPAGEVERVDTYALDDFVDTPVVRCEDGDITVYPVLRLVEIDGELLTTFDALELMGALVNALDNLRCPGASVQTRAGWHVETADGRVLVNGFPHEADEIHKHLRSLQYATRLLDI